MEYVPEFAGNRELPEEEQARVRLRELLARDMLELQFAYAPDPNGASGFMRELLKKSVIEIRNLYMGDEPVTDGKALWEKCPAPYGGLVDEIAGEALKLNGIGPRGVRKRESS